MKVFKKEKSIVQKKNKLLITITVPSHEMGAYKHLADKYADGDILEFTMELIRNSMKEFEDDFKPAPQVSESPGPVEAPI